MSYIEKARALGEALAQSSEVKALVAAEKAIMADPVAKDLFMEYREKEKSVVTAQMLTKVVPEKDAVALLELKAKLSTRNTIIRSYFQALQKYERVMAMVNLMITTAITGTPNMDELPLPEDLKPLASQLLDPKKVEEINSQLAQGKLPPGFKLPPGVKLPGGKQ